MESAINVIFDQYRPGYATARIVNQTQNATIHYHQAQKYVTFSGARFSSEIYEVRFCVCDGTIGQVFFICCLNASVVLWSEFCIMNINIGYCLTSGCCM